VTIENSTTIGLTCHSRLNRSDHVTAEIVGAREGSSNTRM